MHDREDLLLVVVLFGAAGDRVDRGLQFDDLRLGGFRQINGVDDLLRGLSDGAAELARGDNGKFMNAVALRVAPPRSSKSPKTDAKPSPKAEPAPTPEPEARSKLQQLLDKFT